METGNDGIFLNFKQDISVVLEYAITKTYK
jgi:hypothetical protein